MPNLFQEIAASACEAPWETVPQQDRQTQRETRSSNFGHRRDVLVSETLDPIHRSGDRCQQLWVSPGAGGQCAFDLGAGSFPRSGIDTAGQRLAYRHLSAQGAPDYSN